jgi:hypothetical protein
MAMVPERECRIPTLIVSVDVVGGVFVGAADAVVAVGASSPPQAPRTVTSATIKPIKAQKGIRRIRWFKDIVASLFFKLKLLL